MILYEYPLNERVRTYLRLEQLFERLRQLMLREAPIDHHFAFVTVFEIVEVASRFELKSEVLKDLEKNKQSLMALRRNAHIAQDILEDVIAQIQASFAAVNAQNGKTGAALHDNEWVTSVRSRIAIPAGTCGFDLPAYYYWQHQSVQRRQADLKRWTTSLWPIAQAIDLLLKLLRDTGTSQKVMAIAGHYQQNLTQGKSFQLLRLRLESHRPLIPEISGNRLIVSVRLLTPAEDDGLAKAWTEDAGFELTLCN